MTVALKMLDLVRAFDGVRLAALHIDMQMEFHEHRCREGRLPTEKVFPVVKKFAADLKGLSVTNHWVAFTGSWHKGQYRDYRGANNMTRGLRFFPNMGTDDDDFVFQKGERWAFREANCVLEEHLNATETDTLIIDGVKDKHCVTDTIATGLKKGFRFYVALDATNCPMPEFDNFADWFNRGSTDDEKRRVTFTSTVEILSALSCARRQQNSGLIASVG